MMRIDVTQEARYFLACIYRLKKKNNSNAFLISHIWNIIGGVKTKEVVKNNDTEFNLFGWGRESKIKHHWFEIVRKLKSKGYIELLESPRIDKKRYIPLTPDKLIGLTDSGFFWLKSLNSESKHQIFIDDKLTNAEDIEKSSKKIDDNKDDEIQEIYQSFANNFTSSRPNRDTKVIKNQITKFPDHLAYGFRYCYISENKFVKDIAKLIEVNPRTIFEVNRNILKLKFFNGNIPEDSTIIIPEPSDNFWEGFKYRNIGGRKGHRGGVNIDAGVTLMKKGYNPGITY